MFNSSCQIARESNESFERRQKERHNEYEKERAYQTIFFLEIEEGIDFQKAGFVE